MDGAEKLRLLTSTDLPAVIAENTQSPSPFLFVCDHAGRAIPASLGSLGLPESELDRHIAWDIGAAEVARLTAAALSAPCILQRYSRLVVDCNRSPGHIQSMAETSEYTAIPGNRCLEAAQVAGRLDEIFWPYHHAIAAELDYRNGQNLSTALAAIHSFTPVYMGEVRRWQAGVLYGRDPRLALLIKAELERDGLIVGDNEPYQLSDESDFTIPYHAEARRLPYVELEIRQDLIEHAAGQREWANRLIAILPAALDALMLSGK